MTKSNIQFEGNPNGGSGRFSALLILIKENRWKIIYNNLDINERTWALNFEAGQYDSAVLVTNGLDTDGEYEVSINACVSGTWQDNFNFIWTLMQSGNNITGTVQTTTCGLYSVTETLSGTEIILKAAGSCCDFKYTGALDDCESGVGSWENDCGASGSWTIGSHPDVVTRSNWLL